MVEVSQLWRCLGLVDFVMAWMILGPRDAKVEKPLVVKVTL